MSELIAAYSPPIPMPVIARKIAKLQKLHDVAVSRGFRFPRRGGGARGA
jgi:hypothetical protein